ncbi:MAG: hypothetical protein ABI743_14625, partial [bacterium]
MRLVWYASALAVAALLFGCSGGSSTSTPTPNPGNNNPPGGAPQDVNDPFYDNEGPGPIIDPRNLAAPPADPQIAVAPGFTLSIFADGLAGPRHLARRGNEIWVAERGAGRVTVLRDLNGDGYAENKTTAATGVGSNHGMEYYRGWFYIGNTTQIFRFRDDNGDRIADAAPQLIINGLPSGGHVTRTPRVNPFNKKLYVSIGSSCNLCEESNQYRATIWEYNLDGTGGRMFASGLRNAVGIGFREGTRDMWTVVNGWDDLGDTLPHECMWKVVNGGFYGWPYAYSNNGVVVPDPTFGPSHPDKVAITRLADFEFNAHEAPLGICFWSGRDTWGRDYENDAFVAFHGSWVPAAPTGYEVSQVHFNRTTGKPVNRN